MALLQTGHLSRVCPASHPLTAGIGSSAPGYIFYYLKKYLKHFKILFSVAEMSFHTAKLSCTHIVSLFNNFVFS